MADLVAFLVPLILANDLFVGSGVNTMHDTKAVAGQDQISVPADVHTIHHAPVALIADTIHPAFWIQIQQLHVRPGLNVKALQQNRITLASACVTGMTRSVHEWCAGLMAQLPWPEAFSSPTAAAAIIHFLPWPEHLHCC